MRNYSLPVALETWTAKQLVRVELPTPEVGPKQVRVAVSAISVNPVNWKIDQCTPTDQRGVPRPVGSACDIGAVEQR